MNESSREEEDRDPRLRTLSDFIANQRENQHLIFQHFSQAAQQFTNGIGRMFPANPYADHGPGEATSEIRHTSFGPQRPSRERLYGERSRMGDLSPQIISVDAADNGDEAAAVSTHYDRDTGQLIIDEVSTIESGETHLARQAEIDAAATTDSARRLDSDRERAQEQVARPRPWEARASAPSPSVVNAYEDRNAERLLRELKNAEAVIAALLKQRGGQAIIEEDELEGYELGEIAMIHLGDGRWMVDA